jgi:glycyl-tRNA synthetase beta chain
MPTLLFEIGCEELPASACDEVNVQLPELCRRHLNAKPSDLYLGPRRLGALVPDLPERTPDEWVKGPPVSVAFGDDGKPTKAAEGFARKQGVAVEALEQRDGTVGVVAAGEELRAVLPSRLAEIVRGLSFSKSMWWNGDGLRFSRPIRWICAKLDGETISVAFEGIASDGFSYGHRFTSGRVEIPDAQAYLATLRAAGVEPDRARRWHDICAALDELGSWSDPGDVLSEVVHLVESPIVIEGRFDKRFLRLPPRVVITAMQAHQRYFPLGENRFAFVANGGDPDVVRAGNEQVLENRLEDATFTFDRDVEKGIDGLAAQLGSITFIAGGGSFADKTERLVRLVEHLGAADASAEAARLAKADQAAELVREFPDLEGHIGAEYARLAGYPDAVCAAIEEHHLPDASGGPLPATEAGKILAAADKLDTLVVAFALGKQPTGSRDPFGLRRAAIGLCRLAVEGGLEIDLWDPPQLDFHVLASEQQVEALRLTPSTPEDIQEALGPGVPDGLVTELMQLPREMFVPLRPAPLVPILFDLPEFVFDRLEGLLDIPVEYTRAARGAPSRRYLRRTARLALALAALDGERLTKLHESYTRAWRLAAQGLPAREEDPDEEYHHAYERATTVVPDLLTEPAEVELSRVTTEAEAAIRAAVEAEDFDTAFDAAVELAPPLARFFDEVLVMAENAGLRRNRLALLYQVAETLRQLGDFSQIPL